jgi:hypothetical protein
MCTVSSQNIRPDFPFISSREMGGMGRFLVQVPFYTFAPLKFFQIFANGRGCKGDVVNAKGFKEEDTTH